MRAENDFRSEMPSSFPSSRSGEALMRRVHVPSRASLAAICLFALLLPVAVLGGGGGGGGDPSPPVTCSKKCVVQNCQSIGIRYGKYCGVGWSGCPGEKPCDDLDDCCRLHDDCVEKKGLMSVKCHEKFKNCIRKVKKSGKSGFSKECPYETAMATMIQGMDMAILFSQLGASKNEL